MKIIISLVVMQDQRFTVNKQRFMGELILDCTSEVPDTLQQLYSQFTTWYYLPAFFQQSSKFIIIISSYFYHNEMYA